MTDEERETLRAKLILLDTAVIQVGNYSLTGPRWAIVKIGTTHFRFEDRREFYETEDEALAHGLKYMLMGAELTNLIPQWARE